MGMDPFILCVLNILQHDAQAEMLSKFHADNISVFTINGNIKDLPAVINSIACFFLR